MWKRRGLWTFVLLLFAVFVLPDNTFAQRRGGGSRGSSRRSTPRRTVSKPTPKRQTTAKKDTKKKSDFGSATKSKKSAAANKKTTKADVKAYEKAKASGKHGATRADAAKKFRNDPKAKAAMAKKYPSKYATKPATRPGHIPPSYASGGTTYNINYNAGFGGYGYMGPLGAWIAYDIMAHSSQSHMNMMMMNSGYRYGPAPVYRSGGMFILSGVFGIVAVGAVIVIVTRSKSGG